jgi:hypothetical protein
MFQNWVRQNAPKIADILCIKSLPFIAAMDGLSLSLLMTFEILNFGADDSPWLEGSLTSRSASVRETKDTCRCRGVRSSPFVSVLEATAESSCALFCVSE